MAQGGKGGLVNQQTQIFITCLLCVRHCAVCWSDTNMDDAQTGWITWGSNMVGAAVTAFGPGAGKGSICSQDRPPEH